MIPSAWLWASARSKLIDVATAHVPMCLIGRRSRIFLCEKRRSHYDAILEAIHKDDDYKYCNCASR